MKKLELLVGVQAVSPKLMDSPVRRQSGSHPQSAIVLDMERPAAITLSGVLIANVRLYPWPPRDGCRATPSSPQSDLRGGTGDVLEHL
ncbi:MAG: hypothetical protein AB7U75_04860 [Hyphomicrobiaceae bacterium]